MEKLSVKSALSMIDNMSFEDTEQLKDKIIKNKINKLFKIYFKNGIINQDKEYTIKGESREDVIDKFIRSTLFLDNEYELCNPGVQGKLNCKVCGSIFYGPNWTAYNSNAIRTHYKTIHKEQLLNYRRNSFKGVYSCQEVIIDLDECKDPLLN